MNSDFSPILQELRPMIVGLLSEAMVAALKQMETAKPRYPERVNVEKASEITGYSKNSLYQMHSRGLIPGAHKVGGKLLFDTKELILWLEAGGNNKNFIRKENGLPQVANKYEN